MLLMLCAGLLLPIGPGQSGSATAISRASCHESGGGEPDRPVDRQALHMCIGCALPSMKIELAVPKPARDEMSFWPRVGALPGMMSAVDPPPPRG